MSRAAPGLRYGYRATPLPVVGTVLIVALAGCTSTSSDGSTPASGASTSGAAPTRTTPTSAPVTVAMSATPDRPRPPVITGSPPRTVTSTVTRTSSETRRTVDPPVATAEPAAVAGDCPFLNADVVSDITGQHHGQTMLVALYPQPMCVFYRSDGGWMGSVRVIRAATEAAAVAAVNQHVPIAGSQPVSQPAGWTGGSIITPGQMTQDSTARSVYAVSKGDLAVVAEEDESPSLKARLLAVCAIFGLKLGSGPTPDYCVGAQG